MPYSVVDNIHSTYSVAFLPPPGRLGSTIKCNTGAAINCVLSINSNGTKQERTFGIHGVNLATYGLNNVNSNTNRVLSNTVVGYYIVISRGLACSFRLSLQNEL